MSIYVSSDTTAMNIELFAAEMIKNRVWNVYSRQWPFVYVMLLGLPIAHIFHRLILQFRNSELNLCAAISIFRFFFLSVTIIAFKSNSGKHILSYFTNWLDFRFEGNNTQILAAARSTSIDQWSTSIVALDAVLRMAFRGNQKLIKRISAANW